MRLNIKTIYSLFHKNLIALLAVSVLLLTACSALSSGADEGSSADSASSDASESGSSADASSDDESMISVGFSQLGAESDWRSAHSESIRNYLSAENGYNLWFEDGQQKQANQIMAIRTFIQREVDVIALAPVTETGWDSVLTEAKDAGIPVIVVDRRVDVKDEDLFTCWIGSDFELEGKKASEWLHQYTLAIDFAPEDLHIVNIQGTIGSSAQIGRSKGLRQASDKYGWDLMQEVSGDFTQTKGREVMASLLNLYPNLNVVYCENDNEALGAIEAIEAAGKTPGLDLAAGQILILSFDGMNPDAIQYAIDGKIACIGECNPKHGQPLVDVITQLKNGETPEKYTYIEEKLFSGCDLITSVTVDGVDYPVTILAGE
ncbi:MAG: ABC transporter substrate-binding protein, partial [Lachnospiraceae bacterium]|nr:ABC transporter substrate-binding protein [Lachnospiraceae bacterium]